MPHFACIEDDKSAVGYFTCDNYPEVLRKKDDEKDWTSNKKYYLCLRHMRDGVTLARKDKEFNFHFYNLSGSEWKR